MSDENLDNNGYFFVSYSHNDEDAVARELAWLRDAGITIWLDEGIQPGKRWHKEVASRVKGSAGILFFVTPSSITSDNCSREIHFAVQAGIPVIAAHLAPTDMPDEWAFIIGDFQAIFRHKLTESEFRTKLLDALVDFTGDVTTPRASSPPPPPPQRTRIRKTHLAAIGVVAASILVAGIGFFPQNEDSTPASPVPAVAPVTPTVPTRDTEWLTGVALPAMRTAVNEDAYGIGFRHAETIEQAGFGEFLTDEDWRQISVDINITTDPPGADVAFKLYAEDNTEWRALGKSPLEGARLPRDLIVLRAQKPGYETALRVTHSPGIFSRNAAYDYRMRAIFEEFRFTVPEIELIPDEGSASGMVTIPGTNFPLMYPSFNVVQPVDIPRFRIGKTEVTNRDYKEFVDAGGYESPTYWAGLDFLDQGSKLTWEGAMDRFVDQTGRPGPSSWEFGTYSEGRDDYPVSGVSWFEAMAYAKYRESSLPSIMHWVRSAIMLCERWEPIGPRLLPTSNFGGELQRAGSGGIGPYGTYDTAGNLREWVLNKYNGEHVAIGGAYDDPPYTFYSLARFSPFDRSLKNGIRLAHYPETAPEATLADVERAVWEQRTEPLAPEVVRAETAQYVVGDVPLEPVLEYEEARGVGHLRKISLLSGRPGGERFWLYIWTPHNQSGPFDVVVYQGGFSGFATRYPLEQDMPWIENEVFDLLLKSGRAVAWPVLLGSYDRYDGLQAETPGSQRHQELVVERGRQWVREMHYVIDYLEQYNDEFTGNAAYLGLSYGAIWNWWHLMHEPRFQASIQLVGGVGWIPGRQLQHIDYLQFIETPVLFLNGRFDSVVDPELARLAYDHLATPEENKRMVMYDAGHWPLPRNQMTREIVNFLDTHLGNPASSK